MCRFRDESSRFRKLTGILIGIIEGHCTSNDVSMLIAWARDGVMQMEYPDMAMVERLLRFNF